MAGDVPPEGETGGKSTSDVDVKRAFERLQTLAQERQQIFAGTQKIYDRLTEELKPNNVGHFQYDMDRIVKLQDNMDSLHREIIQLNPRVPEKYRVAIEKKENAFEAIVHAAQVLYLSTREKANSGPNAKPNPSGAQSTVKPHIKLPKLELPKFSGKITEWSAFHSLFDVSIHQAATLSDIEKFQFLISKLDGEARQLVGTLELTGENYNAAYEALCTRYNNRRRHIHHHLSSLLDLPDIQHDSALPSLLCNIQEHINALTALGHNKDSYILLLTTVLLRKLPFRLRRRLEDARDDATTYPTFEELERFLQAECSQLDNYNTATKDQKTEPKFHRAKPETSRHFMATEGKGKDEGPKCPLCPQTHPIYVCKDFKKLPIENRAEKINQWRRCTNCLSDSHSSARGCPSKRCCKICQQSHHTLLHKPQPSFMSTQEPSINLASPNRQDTSKGSATLLGTAIVGVKLPNGTIVPVRTVIDSAAMSTFITAKCVKRLGLKYKAYQSQVLGLGDKELTFFGDASLTLIPINKRGPELKTQVEILLSITEKLPTQPIGADVMQRWRHLQLADPNYQDPSEIELLIGAELFPYIYTGNKILTDTQGCALESIFGWVITGKISIPATEPQKKRTLISTEGAALNQMLTKFWEVEEPEARVARNPEDERCEELFVKLHYRLPSGRFVVPLPLKTENPVLENSFWLAKHRLESVERKLRRDKALKSAYVDFMNEYENLGHMELSKTTAQAAYYLPHHGVITTKLRVVFDASMKTSSGISLNDVLHTGPKLQADIVQTLLKFRTYKVAMAADICKMFRQILIRPEDRKYQHILWRQDESEPIREYELCTVTYGMAASPFLTNRVLKQLAKEEWAEFPEACKSLSEDIYIDDWLFGHVSIPRAIQLRDAAIELLKKAGCELAKWASNSPEALEGIEDCNMATPLEFGQDNANSLGVLGVRWTPQSDTFSYKPMEFSRVCTKRAILSNIARIYDPMGWVTPCVLAAKIIIQKLWISGVGWDEPIAHTLADLWLSLLDELHWLTALKIPRLIMNPHLQLITLVGFCDGSESGYGATIFVLSRNEHGIESHLFMAKSKVAPTKPLSVPRLELCGALTLSKLFTIAFTVFSRTEYKIEYFLGLSDSTTVLSWLTTPAFKLKTYVANRVDKILDVVPSVAWGHVSTKDNPADLASRGVLPQRLVNNSLWWTGPEWLQTERKNWKVTSVHSIKETDLPDLKTEKITFMALKQQDNFITRFSEYSRLRIGTAWCRRLFANRKKWISGELQVTGPLTHEELSEATVTLVKLVQSMEFHDDIESIKRGKPTSHRLAPLNPFLDSHGILRVGGRLSPNPAARDVAH
ncbi:uncharacterized protein [Bemisia tabaci]